MELNWLPDHEAVAKIAGPLGPIISTDDAIVELRKAPGLIPAAIDPQTMTIIWTDVGQSDLQEWQFLFSLAAIAERTDGKLTTIRTDLQNLPDLEAAVGATVAPSGFIFHMSRCGSTLLGNVLNRSPRHCAINQPGPLQDGFWTALSNDWRNPSMATGDRAEDEARREILRHLVRAILRQRSEEHLYGFIKFRSWSILFIDFIQEAFPDVPCLFMYRDPIDVLASVIQKKNVAEFATERQRTFLAAHEKFSLRDIENLDFMTACYAHYFVKALGANASQTAFLDYRHLTSANLERILHHGLRLESNIPDLDLMKEEFQFYSKDRAQAKSTFDKARDQRAKTTKVKERVLLEPTSELSRLYDRLEAAANNLFS